MAWVAGLLGLACGGGGSSADAPPAGAADAADSELYFCDHRTTGDQCTEYTSPMQSLIDEFMSNCTGLLAGSLVVSCPTGMVGGCQRLDPSTESFTVWYYPPNTVEDVVCGGSATFVPAP